MLPRQQNQPCTSAGSAEPNGSHLQPVQTSYTVTWSDRSVKTDFLSATAIPRVVKTKEAPNNFKDGVLI